MGFPTNISATDRFPLSFQETLVERLFNKTVSFSWVVSGLGCNVFLAPTFQKASLLFVRFRTGQPFGYLSSWPLFALSHPAVVSNQRQASNLAYFNF